MWIDDKIILLEDISAPPSMAGKMGQVKVIGRDIELYYAKRLVKGGHARLVEDDQVHDVLVELGIAEPKLSPVRKIRKRKESIDARGTNSKTD